MNHLGQISCNFSAVSFVNGAAPEKTESILSILIELIRYFLIVDHSNYERRNLCVSATKLGMHIIRMLNTKRTFISKRCVDCRNEVKSKLGSTTTWSPRYTLA